MKALIFDFDGLILDTESAWFHAYKNVLAEDYQFDLTLDDFVKCVGADDTALFSILDEKMKIPFIAEDIRQKARHLHTVQIEQTPARDGVEAYLKKAKELGLINAICTSSKESWITKHLKHLQLYDYFDYFITQDDVKNIKPDPELFLKSLEVLNVEPHEAIVFEDSLNGLIAAQGANIPTVIIPNPVTNHLPFENYFLKINSMNDLSLEDILIKAKQYKN